MTENAQFRGMAFTGIRGDESISRSEYEDVSLGEKVKGQYSCHPILEWNSAELFLYIYEQNLILNETYKKGNSRAGCLVCPLATTKNMFFKEQCYGDQTEGSLSTKTFNNIILETTAKELSTPEAVKEFMDIAGWKARRSGRELSIARTLCTDNFEKGIITITLLNQSTDWQQWIKTVGDATYLSNGDVEIIYEGKSYIVSHTKIQVKEIFTVPIGTNTKRDIYFMSVM